jgi:hypothetical protein
MGLNCAEQRFYGGNAMRPTQNDLEQILEVRESPCVSIYMPTERPFPDSKQSAVRYRNLVDQVDSSLRGKLPAMELQKLLTRLREPDEPLGWSHREGGLAVFASSSTFRYFDLPGKTRERLVISDSFHVRPLLRVLQSADRFHVLCLQATTAAVFEGNRDGLLRVEDPGFPLTIGEALEAAIVVQGRAPAYAGVADRPAGPAPRGPDVLHKYAESTEVEQFFRIVDQGMLERLSRPSNLPAVLAALPQHQSAFRSLSKNQHLQSCGIELNPASLTEQELLAKAWKCMEPIYEKKLGRIIDNYRAAQAHGQATEDLDEAARSAQAGKIGTLLVDEERVIAGRILPNDAGIALGPDGNGADGGISAGHGPLTEDLLDDIAKLTLRMKGTVVAVPTELLPSPTGVAAIFRYT